MLESFLNKVAGLGSATLLKKRFQHRCFPVDIFQNTYFEEHLRTAASADILLEFCNDTFCNLQFTFLICNFAKTQFWLWKYKFYIEFFYLNFKKYCCPRFNWEVTFLTTSSYQINLQNFSSPLHPSVLQHLSVILSQLFLCRFLSLRYFTYSL